MRGVKVEITNKVIVWDRLDRPKDLEFAIWLADPATPSTHLSARAANHLPLSAAYFPLANVTQISRDII